MRRKLTAVACFVFLFLFVPSEARAEKISQFTGSIRIETPGSIQVNERIRYDFGDESRHGIYRTISTTKQNNEGRRFVLGFDEIAVMDEAGNRQPFERSDSARDITLKIGDPKKIIMGKQLYDISYRVRGALTYFSDHDELYWNITGNDWQVPMDTVTASVTLPQDVENEALRVSCFTGPSGSVQTNCEISSKKKAGIIVQTTRPLAAQEGLTIVVGFPKGLAAVLEPKEFVPFWQTFWGRVVLVVLVVVVILWYIVLPLLLPFFWWKYGRDPKPPVGEATAWFEPPKGRGGTILTPAETGTLVDERADNADITATIVDLARRGYLIIVEKTKGNIELRKVTSTISGDSLKRFEQKLFSGIFNGKDSVNLKSGTLVSVITDTKNMLYESVMSHGFFPRNPQTIRNWFTAGNVFALMTGNFLLLLSILFFGYHMPRKTMAGAQAAAVARALKNFITSQERQFKFQAEKQLLFEKMLPFAIAFGVERIWIARFAQMHLKRPEWYEGYSPVFHVVSFNNSLHSASRSLASAATPTSSSRGFSSGFSGGSSGGGGGGGGGGSW